MLKISFWRYMAVNRKTLLAALVGAMLVFSMLGCGATNKLQSITLNAALINGVAPTGQAGFFTLQGNGGTIQLQAVGNYSNSKTKDITNQVTYNVIVDPDHSVDAYGNNLPAPCVAPCQVSGQGTVEYSPTGLITAVEFATCTWVDIAPLGDAASWFYSGAYEVTATFDGITSQPAYIPVASAAGDQYYPALVNGEPDTNPANENNPSGACGAVSGS